MTRKERFLTAVGGGEADRVPLFDFLFQQPLFEAVIGRRPESYNGKDAVECSLALDMDAVWIPFGGFTGYRPEFVRENVYRDEWGTVYQKDPASWPIDAPIEYPIKSRGDLKKYRPPDPGAPGRDAEIRAARAMDNDEIAITGGIGGPFTTAWLLIGYENICYALYDDPSLVTEAFKISNEFFKEAARASVEAGCSAIWVSEDMGSSSSELFSLDHFRKYHAPYLAEIVEYVDSLGVPVLLHSCGHITGFLPDLAQMKISAIHPLQRTAGMDLRAVKEQYGDRWCIIGNVDSSRTLPYGSVEDVIAETRECIDVAAPGGGYVVASDHSLHDGIPVENIVEMFKFAGRYGREVYRR